jgi:alpha-mannosidase
MTVILRLYEAFGGHGKVQLNVARHIPVAKAFITNLLEDHEQELSVTRADSSASSGSDPDTPNTMACSMTLSFRGFEVKTVKLVIGAPPPSPTSPTTSKESVVLRYSDLSL